MGRGWTARGRRGCRVLRGVLGDESGVFRTEEGQTLEEGMAGCKRDGSDIGAGGGLDLAGYGEGFGGGRREARFG